MDSDRDISEFWNAAFTWLEEHANPLFDEREVARIDAPNLVAAFDLLAAYAGHVHRLDPSLPGLPRSFCVKAPLMCDCAGGDVQACGILFPPPPANVIDCDKLWLIYQSAMAAESVAVEAYVSGGRTSAALSSWLQARSRREHVWRQLVAGQCADASANVVYTLSPVDGPITGPPR